MAKKYAVTALEHAPAVSVVSHEAQESINERGKKLLDTYIRRAKEAGIVSLKGVLVRCTPARALPSHLTAPTPNSSPMSHRACQLTKASSSAAWPPTATSTLSSSAAVASISARLAALYSAPLIRSRSFSRFFMGSTSKYVMENSEANVCIVKAPPAAGDAAAPAKAERAYHGEAIDIKHP